MILCKKNKANIKRSIKYYTTITIISFVLTRISDIFQTSIYDGAGNKDKEYIIALVTLSFCVVLNIAFAIAITRKLKNKDKNAIKENN